MELSGRAGAARGLILAPLALLISLGPRSGKGSEWHGCGHARAVGPSLMAPEKSPRPFLGLRRVSEPCLRMPDSLDGCARSGWIVTPLLALDWAVYRHLWQGARDRT
ncbi:hypothetical protein GCM10010522_69220 [Kribbella solani]